MSKDPTHLNQVLSRDLFLFAIERSYCQVEIYIRREVTSVGHFVRQSITTVRRLVQLIVLIELVYNNKTTMIFIQSFYIFVHPLPLSVHFFQNLFSNII